MKIEVLYQLDDSGGDTVARFRSCSLSSRRKSHLKGQLNRGLKVEICPTTLLENEIVPFWSKALSVIQHLPLEKEGSRRVRNPSSQRTVGASPRISVIGVHSEAMRSSFVDAGFFAPRISQTLSPTVSSLPAPSFAMHTTPYVALQVHCAS